jgi:hypothetical protein
MLEERQSMHDYFRQLLLTVVGQAYGAAGYTLEEAPLKWIAGNFRFIKTLDDGFFAYIDYQVLVYSENEHVDRLPSRFRVQLTRTYAKHIRPIQDVRYASRSLAQLVVEDFGVNILPSADHWWEFRDTDSLGKTLAESGHLAVGYGIPWLAGVN